MAWLFKSTMSKDDLFRQRSLLTASSEGKIKFWDITKKGTLPFNQIDETGTGGTYTMDANHDSQQLATGGMDHAVRIYDLETNKCTVTFDHGEGELTSHWNRVFSVKIDRDDSNLVYSGGWDKMVSMMDIRCKLPVASITGPYLCGDTLDVRKGYCLTGSFRIEDPLEIWDLRMQERIFNVDWSASSPDVEKKEEDGFIMACRLDQNAENVIAASSKNDVLKIINIQSNEVRYEVRETGSPIMSIDVTENVDQVSFGSLNGDVNVLSFKDPSE